jgi:hypothetical protein
MNLYNAKMAERLRNRLQSDFTPVRIWILASSDIFLFSFRIFNFSFRPFLVSLSNETWEVKPGMRIRNREHDFSPKRFGKSRLCVRVHAQLLY